MPLVRARVRNVYGLGNPELYGNANTEDPKAVLEAVNVSGLVGILRQLGDISEFAAEVFHGLQEQVMTITSRSHKFRVRLQNIEAALPPLEKAVLAQTSHIHLAYTDGCDWHARIRNEQNQFIYKDLPRFIMDNYEDCRDPPCFNLLDKFNTAGPGSCLKKYSDPTVFKRASVKYDEAPVENIQRVHKKARKIKKNRSRSGEMVQKEVIMSKRSVSMQFPTSNVNGQTSQNVFIFDKPLKSDKWANSISFDSSSGPGYIDCIFHSSSNIKPEKVESAKVSASGLKMHHSDRPTMQVKEEKPQIKPFFRVNIQHRDIIDSDFPIELKRVVDDDIPRSSFDMWDEKTEIIEPRRIQHVSVNAPEMLLRNYNLGIHEIRPIKNAQTIDILYDSENIKADKVQCDCQHGTDTTRETHGLDSDLDIWERGSVEINFDNMKTGIVEYMKEHDTHKSVQMITTDPDLVMQERGSVEIGTQVDIPYISEEISKSISSDNQVDEVESDTDNYMDALNTIESESESDHDCEAKGEVKKHSFNFSHDGTGDLTDDNHTEPFIFSNQEMMSNLLRSVSTEHEYSPKSFCEVLDIEDSLVDNSESVGNPDCSNFESDSSKLSSSSAAVCKVQTRSDAKIITSLSAVDTCGSAGNTEFSNAVSRSTYNSTICSAQDPKDDKIVNNLAFVTCESSDKLECAEFESVCAESFVCSTVICSAHAPSVDKIINSLSVNPSDVDCSKIESVNIHSSYTVCNPQTPSDDKIINSSPVNIHESSDNPDYSKFESICAELSVSGSILCSAQSPNGDKIIINSSIDTSVSDFDSSKIVPDNTHNSAIFSAQDPSDDIIITSSPFFDSSSDHNLFKFEYDSSEPSSPRSSMCNYQDPNHDEIIPRSPGHICESVPDCIKFDFVSSDSSSFGSTIFNSQTPSSDAIIVRSPVDICESSCNPVGSTFESDSSDPSSSKSAVFDSQVPSSDAIITRPPVDNCESACNPDCSKFDYDINDLSSSSYTIFNSQDPNVSKVITKFSTSQETAEKISNVQPVRFWTNGSLLGLEPSKPPDFNALNTSREISAPIIKNDPANPLSQTTLLKTDTQKSEIDTLVMNSKQFDESPSSKSCMCGNDPEDASMKNTFLEISSRGLNSKPEVSSDRDHKNALEFVHEVPSMNQSSKVLSEVLKIEIPDFPNMKTTSNVLQQKNSESSFQLIDRSHGITTNSFINKVTSDPSESPLPAGHVSVAYQISSEMKSRDQLGYESHINSPPSPPLEHMKISFYANIGSGAPKLKLNFVDRSERYDSSDDMFPSFHLVPDPLFLQHEIGSESEDDIHCRSPPYMLGYLSHHSESDSEWWDYGQTPTSNDHDIYDSSYKMEVESVSNSLEPHGIIDERIQIDSVSESSCPENRVEHYYATALHYLPSLDAINPLPQQETDNIYMKTKILPVPPPVPPMQWWAMKSHDNVSESKQDDTFNIKVLESTIFRQQQQIAEEVVSLTSKKKVPLKLNVAMEENQASDVTNGDERKNLLQQIKTKSFNLRSTVTERLTIIPETSRNSKVTAMLEKADSIRQAFRNDGDEDDDNWSDDA